MFVELSLEARELLLFSLYKVFTLFFGSHILEPLLLLSEGSARIRLTGLFQALLLLVLSVESLADREGDACDNSIDYKGFDIADALFDALVVDLLGLVTLCDELFGELTSLLDYKLEGCEKIWICRAVILLFIRLGNFLIKFFCWRLLQLLCLFLDFLGLFFK